MLIDVTIDVRDLDPTIGPVPNGARVTFARLGPTEDSGTLVSTRPVRTPLTEGHGSVQLQAATVYLVACYSIPGFGRFAIRTGTTSTTLGALWRTGQVDLDQFTPVPVPQTLQDLLAAVPAAYDGGVTY